MHRCLDSSINMCGSALRHMDPTISAHRLIVWHVAISWILELNHLALLLDQSEKYEDLRIEAATNAWCFGPRRTPETSDPWRSGCWYLECREDSIETSSRWSSKIIGLSWLMCHILAEQDLSQNSPVTIGTSPLRCFPRCNWYRTWSRNPR